MAITTRAELIEVLAGLGVIGAAREGLLDAFFTGGTVADATTAAAGVVKKAASVPNLTAQTVTDIATTQTAITAIVNKLNALLAAQRTAGQLT